MNEPLPAPAAPLIVGPQHVRDMMQITCKCGKRFILQPNFEGDWEVTMDGPWTFAHSCGWSVTLPEHIHEHRDQLS